MCVVPPCVVTFAAFTTAVGRVSIVSTSVALLFPGVGSVVPAGAAIVAVFESEPVAESEIGDITVNVTEPPDGRFTVWFMLPEPEAPHDPPAEPVHVQFDPVIAAGRTSVTVAPVTLLGPALVAVIVYVTDPP